MSITLHISRTMHQCEMIYLQWFFLVFQNFDFQGGQKGKREKKSQNDKKFSLLHLIFPESYIIWSSHTCTAFFLFFQNFDSWGLSHSTSQELYIIWLWFSVHMSKMMISPVFFFIFLKFWFWGVSRSKRAKNDLKLLISVCHTLCLRNCRSYQDFWYAHVK